MNRGTGVAPSTDANATDCKNTSYDVNMVNVTPNTAVWWVYTIRTILQRTKASAV